MVLPLIRTDRYSLGTPPEILRGLLRSWEKQLKMRQFWANLQGCRAKKSVALSVISAVPKVSSSWCFHSFANPPFEQLQCQYHSRSTFNQHSIPHSISDEVPPKNPKSDAKLQFASSFLGEKIVCQNLSLETSSPPCHWNPSRVYPSRKAAAGTHPSRTPADSGHAIPKVYRGNDRWICINMKDLLVKWLSPTCLNIWVKSNTFDNSPVWILMVRWIHPKSHSECVDHSSTSLLHLPPPLEFVDKKSGEAVYSSSIKEVG